MKLAGRKMKKSLAVRVKKALSLDLLELPHGLKIAQIRWHPVEDSSGEESLEIDILLDNSTTDKEIETAPIHAIKTTIIESLDRNNVRLFPYFSFYRENEYEPYRD